MAKVGKVKLRSGQVTISSERFGKVRKVIKGHEGFREVQKRSKIARQRSERFGQVREGPLRLQGQG